MAAMQLLIVDDEVEFLDLLQRRLTKRGMEVTTAPSADAALALLAQRSFDVALMDVRMPGMDGIQLLERIKQVRPEIEVVMLTGHASTEAAERGLDLGAFDYLIKPVSLNELLLKLDDAFKKKRLRG